MKPKFKIEKEITSRNSVFYYLYERVYILGFIPHWDKIGAFYSLKQAQGVLESLIAHNKKRVVDETIHFDEGGNEINNK